MMFFGIIYLITTTLVLFFKKEDPSIAEEDELSAIQTYKVIWKILCLRPVQYIIFLFLTYKASGGMFYSSLFNNFIRLISILDLSRHGSSFKPKVN
jgi:hypothetical protein